MHRRSALWQQTLIGTLAQLVVLAALVAALAALVEYLAPSLRQTLVEQISAPLDGRVTAEALSLDWSPVGPALSLDTVRLWRAGASAPAARIQRVRVALSLPALTNGRPAPYAITLEQPRIRVAVGQSARPRLVHWSRAQDPPLTWAKADGLRKRLARLRVRGGRVTFAAAGLPGGTTALSGIDFALGRIPEADRWRLKFAVDVAAWRAHANGEVRFQGTLPNPRSADFTLSAHSAAPVALARWTRAAGGDGSLRIDLDGRWRGHRLESARAALALALPGGAALAPVSIDATLAADQPARAAPIAVKLVQSSGSLAGLGAVTLDGQIRPDTRRVTLSGTDLPGAALAALAKRLAPGLAQTRITAAVPRFALAAGGQRPLKIAAAFHALRVDDPRAALGPVSGVYRQTGDRHTLTLKKAGGTLAVPRLIRGKLAIDDASGHIAWRRNPAGLHLRFDDLTVTSNQARARLNGRLDKPAAGPVRADLGATFAAPKVAPILAHVPQGPDLPNAKLRDWLTHAVDRARVTSATARLRGTLKNFPFADPDSSGAFHLALAARDVTLAYKPGWPKMYDAAGSMTLDGTRLSAMLTRGRVGKIALAESSGHIADVREPVFEVDAHTARTRLEYLRAFILGSPLQDEIGDVMQALNASGPARVDAELAVPLKPDLPKLTVDGRVHLAGDTLRQAALPAPLQKIRGEVAFTRKRVRAEAITGRLLALPIRARIAPTKAGGHRISARATIALPDNQALVGRYLPPPWPDYLRGQTPVRLTFTVGPHGKRSPFQVRSDLAGLAIELPQPLAKPAAVSAPLAVTVAPDGKQVAAHFDQRLTLRLGLGQGRVHRIRALIGADPPQPPDGDGIWIGGTTNRVDGPGWFHVIRRVLAQRASDTDQAAGGGLAFIGADLRLNALTAGRRRLRDLHVVATPSQGATKGWRIGIDGTGAQGKLRVLLPSDGRLQLGARLARLAVQTVPAANNGQTASSGSNDANWPVILADAAPTDLPGANVLIKQLRVDGTPLGQLTLTAKGRPNGWVLNQAALTSEALQAHATIHWTHSDGLTKASAQAKFSGANLLNVLRALGVSAPIRARDTDLQAKLRIAPNPRGLDLRALAGSARLELTHGSLPQVEPGAARYLGLFNISALPQRFRLDFSDVVQPGLAFSKLSAPMNFVNGNLFTDGARIVTPSSNIVASGRVGLVSRDLNLRLVITPKIGSSLTIASAIVGGPIIGAAMYGLQQILQQPLEKLTRVAFTIRGDWSDPSIVNPSADSG